MHGERKSTLLLLFLMVGAGVALAVTFAPRLHAAGPQPDAAIIAEGGGTTIIQGGTGAPGGFVPVLTKLGFHAEQTGAGVTGGFECLALAPEAPTGPHSGQFTVNAMYVTGHVSGATVAGDTATLTGTADVTGLGAGSNVSFTFVARRGGPGATFVLTVSGLTFHEVLLEGASQVNGKD
jgi:hypothetical protein